jgi:hypothetical protein
MGVIEDAAIIVFLRCREHPQKRVLGSHAGSVVEKIFPHSSQQALQAEKTGFPEFNNARANNLGIHKLPSRNGTSPKQKNRHNQKEKLHAPKSLQGKNPNERALSQGKIIYPIGGSFATSIRDQPLASWLFSDDALSGNVDVNAIL